MTRTTIALLTSAALVMASAVTVRAQGKKGSAPKPQQVTSKTTTKISAPKPKTTSAPKTSGPKKTTTVSQTSKGPKTTTAKVAKTTKTTKTTSSPATRSAKADAKKTTTTAKTGTKAAKRDAKAAKSEKTSSTTTTTTTTTTTSGDGDTPVTLTKVQEKLQKNTKLAEKLEGRLPAGTDLMEAADGFRNLGQFVAAVNVSNNLGLDFDTLKTAMVDDGKSLGQAIQSVKTDVESPTLVAQRAETEAQTLIQQTENTTTTTTTSTTTTKTKSKDKPKRTRRTRSGS